MHNIYLQFFMYFWTNFGHMTLTFPVGTSRSLEYFIKNYCVVSPFDINMCEPSVHRITTKDHDIIICLIYCKDMTFDLESNNKNWQEPFFEIHT